MLSLCKTIPQFLEKNLKIAYKSVFQIKGYGYKIIMSASWSPFRSITSDSACAIWHFDKKSQSNRPIINSPIINFVDHILDLNICRILAGASHGVLQILYRVGDPICNCGLFWTVSSQSQNQSFGFLTLEKHDLNWTQFHLRGTSFSVIL